MIRLPRTSLKVSALSGLRALQAEIDRIATYAGQVKAAKEKFTAHNRANDPIFKQVRASLREMCSGAQRCCYCEDSFGNQIEHIKPKDFYPGLVFDWENYLFACGPCNGPKKNHFAVFASTDGRFVDLIRDRGPVRPPVDGAPVMINPRREDPLLFLELDLQGTFLFLPARNLGRRRRIRAEYTISLLRLNVRDELISARKIAYDSYRARLVEYVHRKNESRSKPLLPNLIGGLQRMGQPTVWREMQRQAKDVPELKALFTEAPEAYMW